MYLNANADRAPSQFFNAGHDILNRKVLSSMTIPTPPNKIATNTLL